MTYDLNKMVIYGSLQENNIAIYIMKTTGLRIDKILFITNELLGKEKDDVILDIKSELYDDEYDDDLKIKVKEVYDKSDAIDKICKFISKNWSDDMLAYAYEQNENDLNKIKNKLLNIDGSVYVADYNDLIPNKYDKSKDIYELMEIQGLNMQNLIKENQVHMTYYLSALIETFMSK